MDCERDSAVWMGHDVAVGASLVSRVIAAKDAMLISRPRLRVGSKNVRKSAREPESSFGLMHLTIVTSMHVPIPIVVKMILKWASVDANHKMRT